MAPSTQDGSGHWELHYKHLIEAIQDPIISVDEQGRIKEWNPAAVALFGYSRQETLGSRLCDVIGLPDVPSASLERETTLKKKDGSPLLCEVIALARGPAVEETATFVIRDVTDAKRTGNLLRAQRELALSLTEVETLEEGLRLCCEVAVEVAEMDCGAVYLEDEKTGCLKLVFHKGMASDFAGDLFGDAESAQTRSAKAGSPMYAGSVDMETLFHGSARREGIRALGLVPVWGESGHVGCLCAASHSLDEVPPFARNAAERLAALTGGALARLKAKNALRDSQERLHLVQAAGHVAVFDWNIRTGEVAWAPMPEWPSGSPGYTSEHTYEAITRRIHPDDLARLEALYKDWVSSGREEEEFEYRFFRPNGEMRWKLSNALLIRGPDDEALRMVGTIVDITGRRRTENLLNAERNLARTLGRAGTIEEGLRLCMEAAIEASEMDCGWAYLVDWASGALSLVFHKGLPPGFPERLREAVSINPRFTGVRPLFLRRDELGLLFGEPAESGDLRCMAAVSIWSGNRIVACLNVGSFKVDDVPTFGRIAMERIAGQTRAYVFRLNAEHALRESEEKYRRLFEDSRDAIFIVSPDGRLEECNEAFHGLLGYTKDDMVNLRSGDVYFNARHRSSLLEQIDTTGSVKEFEVKLKRKDGTGADCLVTAARKYSTNGQFAGYEGTIRDVTERRRLELEVLRISGMERREIGQDLHDNIGQQLTGIALKAKSLAQALAKRSLPEAEDAGRLADLVNQAIGQVRNLAKGLVLIDQDAGGLRVLLRELAERMRDLRGVACEAFFTPDTIEVGAMTGTQLYRIAQEAVVNAHKHARAKRIDIHLTQADGATTLRVEDDGIGIASIPGASKGLGLHLMHYRAALINGSLEVKNGPNGGTIVECVVGEHRSSSCID